MPPNPAPAKGRQNPVPAERRHEIIESAKERILAGDTLDQIADSNGISRATLDLWLHALGDEYKQLRQVWLDSLLQRAGEEMEKKDADALGLARARELFKRACWYAERRDPARYGAKGDANQGVAINVYVNREGAMVDITPNQPAIGTRE